MTPTIESVRQEHEQFQPYLEEIRAVADSVGRASTKSVLGRVTEIHEFLAHRLIPHAVAEGRLMLPLVRKLNGGPETAIGMNQCHVQLGQLTDQLESAVARAHEKGMDHGTESELRRILYGLHALLTAHFAQAEDVFTAALEREREPSERADLFEDVERSAEEISDQFE